MEFASPTIKRKNALTEDPMTVNFLVPQNDMTRFDGAWRTNYSANLSNAIDLIGHICTNGDGYILLEGWARM